MIGIVVEQEHRHGHRTGLAQSDAVLRRQRGHTAAQGPAARPNTFRGTSVFMMRSSVTSAAAIGPDWNQNDPV